MLLTVLQDIMFALPNISPFLVLNIRARGIVPWKQHFGLPGEHLVPIGTVLVTIGTKPVICLQGVRSRETAEEKTP